MAGQAKPSALQLSTFTKVTSIPREKSYTDLPVTVCLNAAPAEMTTTTLHERAPVDVVAVLDVSGSMAWDYGNGTTMENHRLELAKEAMAKAIQSLGPAAAAVAAGGARRNRLAVVPFSNVVKQVTPLTEMDMEGQQTVKNAVDALKPGGQADYLMPLKIAAKILDERKAEEKDRLAIIIFVSDGQDHYFKDTDDMKETLTQHKLIKYPIHAFGVSVSEQDSSGGGAKALRAMADATSGSYTSITQDDDVDTMAVAEKLAQLSDKPTSIVAVDVNIHLRSLHPGVSLLRIESSSSSAAAAAADDHKSEIGDDKQSAEITMSTISSGEERKFTVYLNVPEGGQQKGNDDGGGVTTMELLAVGGSYKQSWDDDQEQVALGESVVTVARPPPPPPSTSSCKELEWIEERVAYWHKVKLDLSAMYDKAEEEAAGAVKFQVTEALRQASVEAIDRAMHHDIYTATLVAIKLRHCGTGSTKSG
ncbi:hypothetical protein BDA96_06G005200 [Sorghum bicolor]|uniref:VWFA domain-containing protein n=1 Tax=Sorghum bicolor TaxID=4558 RepID=A0A921QPV3_SORBI|nr:hypothetical protein BDA96_06G005200 [Sorghum bicolor]